MKYINPKDTTIDTMMDKFDEFANTVNNLREKRGLDDSILELDMIDDFILLIDGKEFLVAADAEDMAKRLDDMLCFLTFYESNFVTIDE